MSSNEDHTVFWGEVMDYRVDKAIIGYVATRIGEEVCRMLHHSHHRGNTPTGKKRKRRWEEKEEEVEK